MELPLGLFEIFQGIPFQISPEILRIIPPEISSAVFSEIQVFPTEKNSGIFFSFSKSSFLEFLWIYAETSEILLENSQELLREVSSGGFSEITQIFFQG